jgi:hypothetical protein
MGAIATPFDQLKRAALRGEFLEDPAIRRLDIFTFRLGARSVHAGV